MECPSSESVGITISAKGSQVISPVFSQVTVTGDVNISTAGFTQQDRQVQDLELSKVSKEYKKSIYDLYVTVEEYNSLPGQDVPLADRYTELLIIQRHRLQDKREEELRSKGEIFQQVFQNRANEIHSHITLDQLFKPNDCGSVPRGVILQGHSGHGKSFTSQKIMHDWASGLLFNDFTFVFHLNCKELRKEHSVVDHLSGEVLTAMIFKTLKDCPEKVLFLIDGFDELSFSSDEITIVVPSDPSMCAPVKFTLSALLKGDTLRNCFLLVTTRSTASEKLDKQLKSPKRFTEILGFSEDGVREYFQRFFEDRILSQKVYECVRSNEKLFTFCFVPVICWIVCTVFREHFQESVDTQGHFETSSSIFVHFINTLLRNHCEGSRMPEDELTLLRSLGQLAERGIQKHQVLFDERTVSEVLPDFNVHNPFLCKYLMKKVIYRETMYSFMHLSFQEFFAALNYFLIDDEKEAFRKLQMLLQSTVDQMASEMDCFSQYEENFNYVVQFLFGMSNTKVDAFVKTSSQLAIKAQLKEWLLNIIKMETLPLGMLMFVMHCLYEMHEKEFVVQIFESLGDIVLNINLKRTNCWVLLYCLQCCESIGKLILKGLTAESLRMLGPVLRKCKDLDIDIVELADSGVCDLISVLENAKKIHALRVYDILSAEHVEDILKTLQKQIYVDCVALFVKIISADIIAMSVDLIQYKEVSGAENLFSITSCDGKGHCSHLFFQKHANTLRLAINISPVMVPETVISRISLTLVHHPNTGYIDFNDFLGEVHLLKGLREKPESEKHVDALFSTLQALPGLRDVELTMNCLTERRAMGIFSLLDTCPNIGKIHINKERLGYWDLIGLNEDRHVKRLGSVLCTVENDFSKQATPKLRFLISGEDGMPGAKLILAQTSELAINCQGFLQMFHALCVLRENTSWSNEHVNNLISSLRPLPGLVEVDLTVASLTVSCAVEGLALMQTCPSLQKLWIADCTKCYSRSHLSVTKDSMNRLDAKIVFSVHFGIPISISFSSDMARIDLGRQSSADRDVEANTLFSSLCFMLRLRRAELEVRLLTVSWAVRGLSLIETCPTLQNLQIKERRSSSYLSVTKDAISLSVKDLSDSDVGEMISALGEGKKIDQLRIESSLSTESVEHILTSLHKQKWLGQVFLRVKTLTYNIAATSLHLFQIKEMSGSHKRLWIEKADCRNQSSSKSDSETDDYCSALYLDKFTYELCFRIIGRDQTTAAIVKLAHTSESDVNIEDFLQSLLRKDSPECDELVNALISSLQSLPHLTELDLKVCSLTQGWAAGSFSLLQTCPSLHKLKIKDTHYASLTMTRDSRNLWLNATTGVNFCLAAELLGNSKVATQTAEFRLSQITLCLPELSVRTLGLKDVLLRFYFLKHLVETSPQLVEHVDAMWSFLHSVPGLWEVNIQVNCLTVNWAKRILSLIHSCPTLKSIFFVAGVGWDGLLLEEAVCLLQTSAKRQDCTIRLNGNRCNKTTNQCSEIKDSDQSCNQRVQITI